MNLGAEGANGDEVSNSELTLDSRKQLLWRTEYRTESQCLAVPQAEFTESDNVDIDDESSDYEPEDDENYEENSEEISDSESDDEGISDESLVENPKEKPSKRTTKTTKVGEIHLLYNIYYKLKTF